jgi:hypothetical protein
MERLDTRTVEKETLDLIKKLSADPELKQFNLVGGTALALMIGHRKSIDIDLFSDRRFNAEKIASHLQKEYGAEIRGVIKNSASGMVNGVQVDLHTHAYKWLHPPGEIEGVRMAPLDDIAAMKVHAIVQSGKRLKDFVDLHFLLEHRSWDQIARSYQDKYPDGSRLVAELALLYHKEVDFKKKVELLDRELIWAKIVRRLKEAIRQPEKLFINIERTLDLSKKRKEPPRN